ncbi:Nn.00g075610.m01.CDS01 [Neocucurbitaria sp. VM-36]
MSTEDGIAYQLDDDTGFIAHRGSRPPTNLLLVCRQVHREVIDQFLSTTTFEVQPLTPNDVSWRLDKGKEGTYEALAKSAYASMMKKVLVRIDVSRFMMGRKSQQMNIAAAQVCTFDEIDLAVCTEIVATRAGELCDTLRVSIPNVKAVEIHWIDEFPETIEERGLQLRERVLLPFIRLPGVRVRIRKLVMADKGRTPVNMMMSRVLRRGA